MNFKEYLNLQKPEKSLLSTNTGSEHHNSLKRMTGSGLNRKNPNFVAKCHTEKEHLHPKITACINSKNDTPITSADADFIKIKFGTNNIPITLTKEEPEKALKRTGVYICLHPTSPSGHILRYKG
jgi:hypothetical protein